MDLLSLVIISCPCWRKCIKLPITPLHNCSDCRCWYVGQASSLAYQQLVWTCQKNRIFKSMKNVYPTEWPQFYTATILNWQHVLEDDKYKDIIVESLQFCVKENKVKMYAFVIMSNHIHLVWH
jgi:hypothetical protein